MQDYKKLLVWQRAHELNLKAHRLVRRFPHRYAGLVGQIRRSAESVPSNIVEGRYRQTDRDFARFLNQSVSSLMELEYHLLFARDEGLITAGVFRTFAQEIEILRRMLIAFIKKLRGNIAH
jgi:four helix bundle protein